MATYIKTLTDYNSNKIYPQSTAEAIQRQAGNQTVEQSFFAIESQIGSFATMEQVNSAINALFGNNAASSLQTLEQLAAALGDDPNFAATIMTQLNGKQDALTSSQCGTLNITDVIQGIAGEQNTTTTVPTTGQVKDYVDGQLNSKIGQITIDGRNYTGTSVTLDLSGYIKSSDNGTPLDPLPINASTLNGYTYDYIMSQLSCSAAESLENTSMPIVAWDDNNDNYVYSSLISLNPSTGNISANKVYNAVYNDYAEWFEKDDYNDTFDSGDVCIWTGNGVIKSFQDNDTAVVGVVSNSYGHILGGEKIQNMENNNKKFVPIVLAGRVKFKVMGIVQIGDILVAGKDGFAIVNNEAKPNMIIGKALETSYNPGGKRIQMLIK